MNQRPQLTLDEYRSLTSEERQKATREGRADAILGRNTAPTLADFPAEHQITMDEYRSMRPHDRVAALHSGRMDHIRNPQNTN